MVVLEWIGAVFRWLAGAVVPMFARPVSPVGLAWFLHVLLVAGAAVGLYYAQPHLGVTVKLGRAPNVLRPYWLSTLFLLGYALLWSIVWLWQLLAPNQPATDFPDLDADWAGVVAALEKAGIGIADTPLFLVFGELPGGFDNLFRALPHGLTVAGGTAASASLRVYANRDGIYVTVAGASLLGVQERGGIEELPWADGGSVYSSIGAGRSVGAGQSVGASMGGSVGASVGRSVGASVSRSVGAGGPLQQIQQIIRRANREKRDLTDAEKKRVRDLSGGSGHAGVGPADEDRAVGSVLQNPGIVDEADARLTHVCGLIAASRWPLCPINGALLAVPAHATDRDEGAQQWGLVARQDLGVTEAALKLRFPVFALVGGVEALPGGQTFFERFAADKGGQRLGKGFPLNPEVRPESFGPAVEAGVNWVFGNLLPYWALRLMRVDSGADSRDNAGLARFLAEVRRRGPHLARLVSRAVVPHDARPPVYGGCYLSVFLNSAPDEARFAREFFKKVESTQGAVAWTDEAFDEDAGYRSMTRLGYVVLALILAGTLGFAGYVASTTWVK